MRDRLAYGAYAVGWRLVAALPERAAYGAFRLLADLAWRADGAGVRRLEANLARVVGGEPGDPAMRRLSRRAMRSYLRYWCDAFRLATWSRERVVSTVEVEGLEHYEAALAAGTGLVLALPHTGNWDHAGAWSTAQGGLVTTVAERLRPERLFERFVAYRASLGLEVLPLDAGPGPLLQRLAAAVRENRVVCLLADRDLKASGLPVTFFGERATMPPGPALVALRTGAPLHAATVSYTRRGIRLRFHEPVRVPAAGSTRDKALAMTQQLADAFAEAIAAHPEDWHMLQPLWTADAASTAHRRAA